MGSDGQRSRGGAGRRDLRRGGVVVADGGATPGWQAQPLGQEATPADDGGRPRLDPAGGGDAARRRPRPVPGEQRDPDDPHDDRRSDGRVVSRPPPTGRLHDQPEWDPVGDMGGVGDDDRLRLAPEGVDPEERRDDRRRFEHHRPADGPRPVPAAGDDGVGDTKQDAVGEVVPPPGDAGPGAGGRGPGQEDAVGVDRCEHPHADQRERHPKQVVADGPDGTPEDPGADGDVETGQRPAARAGDHRGRHHEQGPREGHRKEPGTKGTQARDPGEERGHGQQAREDDGGANEWRGRRTAPPGSTGRP